MVVGGGEVAARKCALLRRADARIHVVAKSISNQLRDACDPDTTVFQESDFSPELLDGAVIAVAATDSESVNLDVSEAANDRDIPVNVVDQPQLCSFIMPAIVDRSPLVVAISSSGTSPVFSRKIKELIETHIPARAANLAKLMGSFRPKIKQKLDNFDARLGFWEKALDSDIPELVYSGQEEAARERIDSLLVAESAEQLASSDGTGRGEVYLVGAGPGDPDLLTLRALRLMHKADVVLYDRLVSAEILRRIRPDAEKIHVGKQAKHHTVPQEDINDMLVRFAKEGKRVLRLKGGDPFIFGRGGEEIATLAEAGVSFQIVPGITAASGCASYAGIPLTHRDHSQSVQLVTGHMKDGELDLNWKSLIVEQQTLVFYMSLLSLNKITDRLIENGMSPAMPVAVVQQGTTGNQRIVAGKLQSIARLVETAELEAPTITIIGEVVKLRESLSWFEPAMD